eukprot:CAMPEP_0184446504 /NCGR_PEP_ID=MMETSP0740-20130409/2977_1 /TAXON_ID=385413 /ORGANISM="Thalassiosira miniscula, Strain CCMP1093" /LENGTH=53 /DNA_ID=CAMNT_0026815859 /DNA_START=199 /DNA_END=360 /DNA_ORIENTATION=+
MSSDYGSPVGTNEGMDDTEGPDDELGLMLGLSLGLSVGLALGLALGIELGSKQ